MHNNVIVFHRGNRVWEQRTYNQYNELVEKTPIKEDVILVVAIKGNQTRIVKKLGKNMFYLPHGIYVDKKDYLYTTDVGSHTVAKWKINGDNLELIWESGQKLQPGNDHEHFCKPSGVVEFGGDIFISDGYCNSRIVQLDGVSGKRKNQFGMFGSGPTQFNLPHDVSISPNGHLLVADRENGRVQEFSIDGDFIMEWVSNLYTNIYSVDTYGSSIYMLPGRARDKSVPIHVYVGRSGTGLIEFSFGPISHPFGQPHVMRISPDGQHIFIGDIADGRGTLWMFRIQHEEGSTVLRKSLLMDSSRITPMATGTNGILISLVFAVVVVGSVVVYHRRFRYTNSHGHTHFDKKGFKPLRTDEVAGFISDGSDSE